MSTYNVNSVADIVHTVNAIQDRIVSDLLVPYSVTVTYWAFSFVFLYLGLQKVVPHRSTADVQLATIAGLFGLPYIPFVTFVGIWQMVIGGLFLVRRLRLCAWFFLSYQVFTFATLIVLRKIVFQPPWIPVLGFEVPWALGAYAAFVLKNLIFAAIFFVLASHEFGTTEPTTDHEKSADSSPLLSQVSTAYVHVPVLSRKLAVSEKRRTLLSGGVLGRAVRWVQKPLHAGPNYLVNNYFREYGITILYWSYGFVWFYFGFQKPSPAYSPVRDPLADFLPQFYIPLMVGLVFIGLYEMFLGILFFLKEIRVAFWFFFAHQAVTFVTLFVIPFVSFQPPWLEIVGVRFPWALTGFGAFVVKNVVFVAGFALLASIELGDLSISGDTETDVAGATGD